MRVLVCGDRNWTDRDKIRNLLITFPKDTIIIEGEAKGADTIARDVAISLGLSVLPFPADWNLYGRAAGPIRNKQMLTEGQPDQVHAFHSDITSSRGTRNMVNQARAKGIPVEIHI